MSLEPNVMVSDVRRVFVCACPHFFCGTLGDFWQSLLLLRQLQTLWMCFYWSW
jgi:hypothetical protein